MDKVVILTIGLFLITPKIGSIDFSIFILLACVFLRLLFPTKRKIYANLQSFRVFIFFISVVFFISAISAITNGVFTPEYVLKPIRILLVSIILLYIFALYAVRERDVFYGVILAAVVNSIFIYIQYFGTALGYPELGSFGTTFNLEKLTPFRKTGILSGFPTAGLLSLFGFLSLYSVYLSKVNLNKFLIISLMIFLLGTQFITSRTSLILTILIFVWWGVFIGQLKTKLSLIVILGLFIIIVSVSMKDSAYQDTFDKTSRHMFEFYWHYIEEGALRTNSSDSLLSKHFYLPENPNTFLIGNSIKAFSLNAGSVWSDVFFIRVLHGIGIFGLILYLIAFFYIFYISFNKSNSKHLKRYVLAVFLIVFISSFKGSYIFSRTLGDITLLIYMYILTSIPSRYK